MQRLISLFMEWCNEREKRQRLYAYREGFFWAIDEYCFYHKTVQGIFLDCEVATIKARTPSNWRDDMQDEVIKGAQAAIAFITHSIIPTDITDM